MNQSPIAPTIERNEVFELAFRFVTETGENIFLTGKAGTGKTTFLKYLKANCTKNTIVAAPTGVAAINAGGVTLHSLFQLPFSPFIPTHAGKEELLGKMKFNKQRIQMLRKMELLVIDEISMVRADVMDAIDTLLKSVRRNYNIPFGGVQLLCIGDLHQLPPVAQNHEWSILQEYYASPFFFDSQAIKEQQPVLIELNKIYRQKEESFVQLLNNVRTNNMAADDFDLLHERYIPSFRPAYDDNYITLTSHNRQADVINNNELEKLLSSPFVYGAEIEGEFAENIYPAESSLLLKVGAQVMFIKNDPIEKRYFNGKIGVITELEDEKIVVDCDGVYINVAQDTWENNRYTLNRTDGKLQQETIGTFTQFPLRLAWAITIHKSQGLTFTKVMIDAAAAFSSGQVYVALSRCTSLDGIVLLNKIPQSAITSSERVTKGQQQLMHKGSLAERFAGARQMYTQLILEDVFGFAEAEDSLDALKLYINLHKETLQTGAIDWIETLQQQFLIDKTNGVKFIRHINAMMKEEAVIEKNQALQTRLSAAVNHFIPHIELLLQNLKTHPLLTEHKETADVINEWLNNAAINFYLCQYNMQHCLQNFTLSSFLAHKLNYAQPKFNLSCYAVSKKLARVDSVNPQLYIALKAWRDKICDDENLPLYLIATHAMLVDICTYLPLSNRALLLISGFGKAKIDKYGEEITGFVKSYCEEFNIETNIDAKAPTPKKERKVKPKPTVEKPTTQQSTYALFKGGKSIAEIASDRNLTVATVEGHVAALIETSVIDVTEVMPKEKIDEITTVVKQHEGNTLTELKILLPNVSFGEIKMAVAAIKAANNMEL